MNWQEIYAMCSDPELPNEVLSDALKDLPDYQEDKPMAKVYTVFCRAMFENEYSWNLGSYLNKKKAQSLVNKYNKWLRKYGLHYDSNGYNDYPYPIPKCRFDPELEELIRDSANEIDESGLILAEYLGAEYKLCESDLLG